MLIARRGFTLVDLVVVVAVVVLGATFFAAQSRVSRESARRVSCSSHLKQIGQAILLYEQQFKAWPRTRYDPATADHPTAWTRPDSTTPFAADGPAANDVTAAYRLLVARTDLISTAFLCPSSPIADAEVARAASDVARANFRDERELSYSFANPYPNAAARDAAYKLTTLISAEFAVASDVNPGDVPPDGDVTAVLSTASSRDTRRANSPNHDRNGQNVLYGDGHVEFQQSPFVGVARDNIFTFGAVPTSGVNGSPTRADDSVLLPTVDVALWRRERILTNGPWYVALAVLPIAILFRMWQVFRPSPLPPA